MSVTATAAEASANAKAAATAAPTERTLWIIGSEPASFTAAHSIVEQVRLRYPRVHFVLSPRDPALSGHLREEYRASLIEDHPPGSVSRCLRLVRRHNPRLLLVLDDLTRFESALLLAARRRQIPIAFLATGNAGQSIAMPDLLDLVDCAIALNHDSAGALVARGMMPGRITDVTGPDVVPLAADALFALLRRDLKALRSEHAVFRRWLENLARTAADRPWSRRLVQRRLQRIDTLGELADELGRPQTILCLGNGPSSEDPRVRAVAHDALFRVNHMWQERGVLTDPDVVFTGTTDTVRRLGRAIVAISRIQSEGRMLLAGVTRRGRPFRFITLERLGVLVPNPAWGAVVPTNGVFMLATAVALRPARLVVAGIDLFRHREGAYPGDPHTPNAYTPRHAADLDEHLILAILDAYEGELVLIGEVLEAAWAKRRAAMRAGIDQPPTVVSDAAGRYASDRRVVQ